MLHIKNDLGSGVNNSVWVKNTRCARYRASRRRAFPGGRAALALCHDCYAIYRIHAEWSAESAGAYLLRFKVTRQLPQSYQTLQPDSVCTPDDARRS